MKLIKTQKRDPYATNKLNVWIQTCPHCRQVWVIGEVAEHEAYRCKTCKREFNISREHLPPRLAAAA